MPHKDPEVRRAYSKAYYQKPEPKRKAKQYRDTHKAGIHKKSQNYWFANKPMLLQKHKDWRAKKRAEKAMAKLLTQEADAQALALKKEARRLRTAAWQHDYYLRHREEVSAKGKASRKESRAREALNRAANPGRFRAKDRRRRAAKMHAPVNDLTHQQWLEIQEAQGHRCYYCGKRCKGRLTQDHLTPLSKGGSHTVHNVIGACKPCNSSKGAGHAPIPVQPFLLTVAPAKPKRNAS